MQIIQELRAGTVHYSTQSESGEGFTTKPPTHLNLRAARALEELLQVTQGLERANQTLAEQLTQTQGELLAQRSLLEKLLADAQFSSTGAVDADSEKSAGQGTGDVADETNSTHAAVGSK